MKVILDREGLRRRATRSHAASLGGLLIVLSSVAISLWKPAWTTLTTILLFGGFSLAVVGIYYANRWVKKPRPEEVLDQALKGLSDQHRLYHYCLPCDHVLLTTAGLVVLEICSLEGQFSYRNGKWRQKITAGRAMRFFVEEKLGDPIARAQDCSLAIKEQIASYLPEGANVPVQAMVVFTNPSAELEIEQPAAPVCLPKKLRGRLPKGQGKLAASIYQLLREKLDERAARANALEERLAR